MATIKNILLLFAILVSSTIILAQESSSDIPTSDIPTSDISTDTTDGTTEPPMPSSASGAFSHFAFQAPTFDWSLIPGAGFFGGGSRQKRAAAQSEDVEHAAQDQAFFRRVVRCNFMTEGGFRCTSCNTVRRCYPFNIGTVSTCSGLLPYCRNGRCSFSEGPLCRSTSSSTSTSTTSSSSSSSSSSSTTSSSSTSSGNSTAG